MIRHVIWDWNGTLLDDRWLCIEAINQLLFARELPILSTNRYLEIFDFPVREYYQKAGFNFDREPFEVPAMEFIDIYRRRKFECSLQSGARQVITSLRKLGIEQSVLSASEQDLLIEMLDFFGISGEMMAITGLDNHYAGGKKDMGKIHLRKLKIHPEEIVMIGDTCHDQKVAESLGIGCILYTQGHFPDWRLTECSGTLVSDLEQIPSLIGSL